MSSDSVGSCEQDLPGAHGVTGWEKADLASDEAAKLGVHEERVLLPRGWKGPNRSVWGETAFQTEGTAQVKAQMRRQARYFLRTERGPVGLSLRPEWALWVAVSAEQINQIEHVFPLPCSGWRVILRKIRACSGSFFYVPSPQKLFFFVGGELTFLRFLKMNLRHGESPQMLHIRKGVWVGENAFIWKTVWPGSEPPLSHLRDVLS